MNVRRILRCSLPSLSHHNHSVSHCSLPVRKNVFSLKLNKTFGPPFTHNSTLASTQKEFLFHIWDKLRAMHTLRLAKELQRIAFVPPLFGFDHTRLFPKKKNAGCARTDPTFSWERTPLTRFWGCKYKPHILFKSLRSEFYFCVRNPTQSSTRMRGQGPGARATLFPILPNNCTQLYQTTARFKSSGGWDPHPIILPQSVRVWYCFSHCVLRRLRASSCAH